LARLIMLFTAALLVPVCLFAHDITVEAENYATYYNLGGGSIYITACSAASGGYAVEGFDYPGDWIEVTVNVPNAGAFADTLRSAGLSGNESDIRITIFGAGQSGYDVLSDYHTLGLGIG
jgi:hypothetical protein